MSWETQGRQDHGWFGHGTAPQDANNGDERQFGPQGLSQRIGAVAYGAIASPPPALRAWAGFQLNARALSQLTEIMTAWTRGAKLDPTIFAERFFGRGADNPIAVKLRAAAQGAAGAPGHAELRHASDRLGEVMQLIGPDRWPRFLVDAQDNANDPATIAAIEKSERPTDPNHDRALPVIFGPVEAVLAAGAVTAALAKEGVRAALSVIGEQVVKRLVPAPEPITPESLFAGRSVRSLEESGNIPNPADSSGQLTKAGRSLQKHGARPGSAFPSAQENPSSVNKQGQDALKTILNDPTTTMKNGNRFRGFDLRNASGQGARL